VTTSTGLAIEIKGLTKRFGPTLALNNVDLAVGRGRSCALLGRNGAGKSTLIAALMGLIQADEGEIAVRATLDESLSVALCGVNELPRVLRLECCTPVETGTRAPPTLGVTRLTRTRRPKCRPLRGPIRYEF